MIEDVLFKFYILTADFFTRSTNNVNHRNYVDLSGLAYFKDFNIKTQFFYL